MQKGYNIKPPNKSGLESQNINEYQNQSYEESKIRTPISHISDKNSKWTKNKQKQINIKRVKL